MFFICMSSLPSINVFARSDAVATIYFTARFCAVTIRELRLFLSSLLDTAEVEESDPFADVEEEKNELEENEVVLEDC